MPYFLHLASLTIDADGFTWDVDKPDDIDWPIVYKPRPRAFLNVDDVEVFDDRASAHRRLSELTDGDNVKRVVTFAPHPDELDRWRSREYERMDNGTYVRVPWRSDGWYLEYCADHYCHLSISHPGMVAYTPDVEHGVQDRQIRTTPGRYLQKFAAEHISAERIATYVARVKSFTGELHLATDADTIEQVYVHGPRSCMSGTASRYRTGGIHPSRVYAGPDLAVAYLGDPSAASARSVVWPEKKIYTRIYGDSTLEHVLRAAGYSHGTLDDAKIQKITIDGNAYVMPYVDAADSARFDRSGKYIVLREGDGNLGVKHTNGTTEDDEYWDNQDCDDDDDYSTCDHCGDRCGYDETYCDACFESRHRCEDCHDHFWDDGEQLNGDWYCHACAQTYHVVCGQCDDEFITLDEFSQAELDDRDRRHVTHLCKDCAEFVQACADPDCGKTFDVDDTKCPHCGLTVRCDRTANLLADVPAETIADGPAWWSHPDMRDTYWYRDVDGRTWYTSVGVRWILQPSVFNTLDDMPPFYRVVDPRPTVDQLYPLPGNLIATVEEHV